MSFANGEDYLKKILTLLKDYVVTDAEPPFTAFTTKGMIKLSSESQEKARLAHGELGQLFKNYRSPLRGPQKRVFGMPYAVGTKEVINKRRASSLIFHIHPIEIRPKEQKYLWLVLLLPAVFYHEALLNDVDNKLLTGFLDCLSGVSL